MKFLHKNFAEYEPKYRFLIGSSLILLFGCFFFYNCFVVYKLWSWFLVPILGIKPLTIWQAVGLSFVFGYLTQPRLIPAIDTRDKLTETMFYHVTKTTAGLGIGFLLSLLV
jgi:hypothetical protein